MYLFFARQNVKWMEHLAAACSAASCAPTLPPPSHLSPMLRWQPPLGIATTWIQPVALLPAKMLHHSNGSFCLSGTVLNALWMFSESIFKLAPHSRSIIISTPLIRNWSLREVKGSDEELRAGKSRAGVLWLQSLGCLTTNALLCEGQSLPHSPGDFLSIHLQLPGGRCVSSVPRWHVIATTHPYQNGSYSDKLDCICWGLHLAD